MNSVETISIASLLQTAPSATIAAAGGCKKCLRGDTSGGRNVSSMVADADQYESGQADADADNVRRSEESQGDSGNQGKANQPRPRTRNAGEDENSPQCDAVSTNVSAADFGQQIVPAQPNISQPFAEIIAQVAQVATEQQNVVEASAGEIKPAVQIPDAVLPQVQFVMPRPEAPAETVNVPQPVVTGQAPVELSPLQPAQLQGEQQQMFAADGITMQPVAGVEQGKFVPAAPEAAATLTGQEADAVEAGEVQSQLSSVPEPQTAAGTDNDNKTADKLAPVSSAGSFEAVESKPAANSESRPGRYENKYRPVKAVDSDSAADKTAGLAAASYRNPGRASVEQAGRDADEAIRSFEPRLGGAAEAGVKPLETASNVPSQVVRPAISQSADAVDVTPAEQITQFARVSNLRVGQQVTVQLDPPELGHVRLSLQSDGKDIRGVVEVDNHRTLVEIQKEASSLMGRMADSGISVRRMDVVLNDPGQGGQHGADSMLRDWSGQHGQNRDSYAAADSGENLFAGEYADDADVSGELVTDSSINVRI